MRTKDIKVLMMVDADVDAETDAHPILAVDASKFGSDEYRKFVTEKVGDAVNISGYDWENDWAQDKEDWEDVIDLLVQGKDGEWDEFYLYYTTIEACV